MKQFPLPIRFSIPAVLLLFGSLVGLFSFEREVSLSYAQKRVEPSGKILWESNIRDVGYLYRNDVDGAELVLSQIGTDSTRFGIAMKNNRVILATRYQRRSRSNTPAAKACQI